MPASTPNFAIVYPCAGDTIDPGVFQDNAESIQDALDTVSALADMAVRPAAAHALRNASQVAPINVSTLISYDTEVYDRGTIFDVALPTLMIIPENGSYLVALQVNILAEPGTTFTSFRGSLSVGGIEVAAVKSDGALTATPAYPIWTAYFLAATTIGTPITSNVLVTGSGTNPTIDAQIVVTKVANV